MGWKNSQIYGCGGILFYLYMYMLFNRTFCKQTMETHCVCSVCLCPKKGRKAYMGYMSFNSIWFRFSSCVSNHIHLRCKYIVDTVRSISHYSYHWSWGTILTSISLDTTWSLKSWSTCWSWRSFWTLNKRQTWMIQRLAFKNTCKVWLVTCK